MSGRRQGFFGASRALAQAAGVIAGRPPTVDNISGTLDKESAWVDKIGGGSGAEEADRADEPAADARAIREAAR